MPRLGDVYIAPYRFRTKFLDPFYKGNLIRFIVVKIVEDHRFHHRKQYGLMPYVAGNEQGQRVLDALQIDNLNKAIYWVSKDTLENDWKLEA